MKTKRYEAKADAKTRLSKAKDVNKATKYKVNSKSNIGLLGCKAKAKALSENFIYGQVKHCKEVMSYAKRLCLMRKNMDNR